jgi:hypothetical protein
MSKVEASKNQKKAPSKNKNTHRLRSKLLSLLETSSSHGIPNIIRSPRKSIKAIWALCLAAAIGACAYMVSSSIIDYLEYDTVTKTEHITELKSTFPTVTICNVNPLSSLDSELLVESIAVNELKLDLNKNNLSLTDLYANISLANKLALLLAYNSSNTTRYGEIGSQVLCTFDDEMCSSADFKPYFDVNLGNCVQFNSGDGVKLKESVRSGSKNGFYIQYMLNENLNKFSSIYSEGLKVFIHNNSLPPSEASSVIVQPSKSSLVSIERTFIHKQAYPYSECIDLAKFSSEFYKILIRSNRVYRQEDCFYLCLQKRIIQNCGCYDLNYLKIDGSSPCLDKEEHLCTVNQYNLFKKSNVDDSCSTLCPLECDSVEYNLLVSSANYPSFSSYLVYGKYFENMTFEELQKKSIAISIFYSDLSYIYIGESVKTLVIDLFSNIGGTLGLFVGVSMLSLIEIVEILIEVVFIRFNV